MRIAYRWNDRGPLEAFENEITLIFVVLQVADNVCARIHALVFSSLARCTPPLATSGHVTLFDSPSQHSFDFVAEMMRMAQSIKGEWYYPARQSRPYPVPHNHHSHCKICGIQ